MLIYAILLKFDHRANFFVKIADLGFGGNSLKLHLIKFWTQKNFLNPLFY